MSRAEARLGDHVSVNDEDHGTRAMHGGDLWQSCFCCVWLRWPRRPRVTSGNAPGPVTVRVAQEDPTAPAMCQTIEVPRTTPGVREGHGIYPAFPLSFRR